MRTYIEIILLGYIFSLILTREFCLLCAQGRAGHFAKRNTKFGGGGKARAGPEGETSFPDGVNKNFFFLLAP